MSASIRRFVTVCILLVLAWGGTTFPAQTAQAQDGGELIEYNTPTIVTLTPGQTITRNFAVVAGDSFELRLVPLADFTYTAVLLDPASNATPLPPDDAGTVVAVMENAPAGGLYGIVVQATSDVGGDLLIQINSDAIAPVDLALGELQVDTSASARFRLAPPPGTGPTTLRLASIVPEGEPGTNLPAFTLIRVDTGEAVLSVLGDALPQVLVNLPPDVEFLLSLESSELPQQALIEWVAAPSDPDAASTPSSDAPSSDAPSSEDAPAAQPAATNCFITVLGPASVNLRSGPGLEFEPPVGVAPVGAVLPVIARTADFGWYLVQQNDLTAWIAGQINATQTEGDCTTVPVQTGPLLAGTSTPTTTYTPSPTFTPGGPTLTPTATYTVTASPTATYTPTMTYTPGGPTVTYTYTPSATYTYTPSPTYTYTPTPTNTNPPPVQPTATYTPSYTPTTPPAAQVAPEDPRFNNPLNIPLDNTASVLDFVSYPGGDQEDRVRWDITGMNPNASLSGGRARLVIAVSCFGEGTQYIEFFTGGQTYSCGQTIVDREVTYDSRTGSVVITAVGGTGTYVQWVLTGTATRVN